ncbi:hypothetical protein [Larkinella sp. C7]|jgi:hypothetical protein|uniref:hypothetical protein n=1 Tax=Larkinella sp. C7 TaxID=2576607 RepID=UPI001111390D|nr:hypothetical protein [Larkinella sp. C7]
MKQYPSFLKALLWAGFLGAASPVLAQKTSGSLPLRLTLFSESTSIPFADGLVTQPLHPGVSLGTEWALKRRSTSRLVQGLTAGYYHHKEVAQGIFLGTDFRYERQLPLSLYASIGLGIGYLHTFRTQDEFRLKDGRYVLKKDRGTPHLLLSVPLEIGLRFRPDSPKSPRLFVQYQPWIEYPFSPDFIPLMTHTNLAVGYQFFPFR